MICEVTRYDPTTDLDVETVLVESADQARTVQARMLNEHPDHTVLVFAASDDLHRVWGPLDVRPVARLGNGLPVTDPQLRAHLRRVSQGWTGPGYAA